MYMYLYLSSLLPVEPGACIDHAVWSQMLALLGQIIRPATLPELRSFPCLIVAVSQPASLSAVLMSHCSNVSSSGFKLTSRSRQTSKLSQLEAMLGATLRRLGTMPLYSPLTPSCVMMTRMASVRDLY